MIIMDENGVPRQNASLEIISVYLISILVLITSNINGNNQMNDDFNDYYNHTLHLFDQYLIQNRALWPDFLSLCITFNNQILYEEMIHIIHFIDNENID